MNQAPPSLLHAVRPWLDADSNCEALVFGDRRWTYRDVAAHACALAERLRELDVDSGTRVGIMFTPRPEAVIALLACWLLGAVPTGLNPRYRREEQRQILLDSEATVLLSVVRDGHRDLEPDLGEHESQLGVRAIRFGPGFWQGDLPAPWSDAAIEAAWDRALGAFDARIPAVAIYTSGSTGRPKGALLTHAGLAFRSWTLWHDRLESRRVRQLLDLPVNHVTALASIIGVALVCGGPLVTSEHFDPAFTLAAIARERLDMLTCVPTMLARIVGHPDFEAADLRSLWQINWGAAPLRPEVLERLLETTCARLSQQYGMTECHGPIVYTPPTRERAILMETTGKPDPRLELRIADGQDRAVPIGIEGEVQLRQPFPFAGYLGNPEATAQAFTVDGFLRTGDRALIRSDGYLIFCGRSKEMYKSGGYNVYPREVEILLESHPAIRAAAVLGVDDPLWGQVGHAFVELQGECPVEDIVAWCHEHLANYKVPKAFTLIESMPRISVEKVDRVELARRLHATGQA